MTRITLDLEALLQEGRIDEAEAQRLKSMAITGNRLSILANILCIFGAVALAAGVVALKPDPSTGLLLALIALAIAGFIRLTSYDEWRILCDGMAIAGTAGICGWLGLEFGDAWGATAINGIALVIVLASALAFKNAFIAAFAPLIIGSIIGSGTAYWHASYGIFVREALVSIILFSVLALGLYHVAKNIGRWGYANWRMIALIPARVSFFMINFGFWVGSLWGDWPGEHFVARGELDWENTKEWRDTALFIPDWVFAIGWAGFLAFGIYFGLREHNRFITNTSIVFLAIHFYTQLFEYLGAEPVTLVFGGLTMLALAVWLFRFDRRQFSASPGETTTH